MFGEGIPVCHLSIGLLNLNYKYYHNVNITLALLLKNKQGEQMKLAKLSLITVFFLITASAYSQDIKRYEFETGYAEKTSTTVSTGIESTKNVKIYITQFGKKEAHYITEKRNISLMGSKKVEESKSVTIIDGEWIITYDPDKKTGTKMKNPMYDSFKGKSEEEMKKFAEQMGDAMNTEVKEKGTEVILGKTCKVSEGVSNMMGMKTTTKMWMYKNFMMKMQTEGMGSKVNETTTKFEEGAKVDPNKLKIPSEVKITEMQMPGMK